MYDYLRLLYARAGEPHCPTCGERISRQTPQQIVDQVLDLEEGTRFQVLAPVVRTRKGEFVDLFAELQISALRQLAGFDGAHHRQRASGSTAPPCRTGWRRAPKLRPVESVGDEQRERQVEVT